MRSDRTSVPVTVITGFLGSGKTTVLNRLLRVPDLADTAVIINEFGEVSLDHLLIEQAIENAVLLKNGCICCTVRGDILDTIEELFRKRETGELPWFRRIAIETTGLADPAPVVHTLSDTNRPCHLDGIVVTADAVHIRAQLTRQEEARQQIAFADRILLTKTDLVTTAGSGCGGDRDPRAQRTGADQTGGRWRRDARGHLRFGAGTPPGELAASRRASARPRACPPRWHRLDRASRRRANRRAGPGAVARTRCCRCMAPRCCA